MSILATETATELMESWHRGFCDGLEMAAKLADGMSDRFEMNESQRAVLRAVRDFLREFQLKAQLDK
jgi:ATP-dependent exoDNAse (exonuclease V) beta subunit